MLLHICRFLITIINIYIIISIQAPNELKSRVDNIIYAGGGLSRPVTKWLRLRLDYLYYNRGSNFSFYSFNEHKVLLGVQSSF